MQCQECLEGQCGVISKKKQKQKQNTENTHIFKFKKKILKWHLQDGFILLKFLGTKTPVAFFKNIFLCLLWNGIFSFYEMMNIINNFEVI